MTYVEPSLPPPYLPVEVSDVEMAFPAHGLRLMPAYDSVEPDPEWQRFAEDWFRVGLGELSLLPTPFLVDSGFTPEQAWRHLSCIIGSYEPRHQHKLQALGFLLGHWFRWAEWSPGDQQHILKHVGSTEVEVTDAPQESNDH